MSFSPADLTAALRQFASCDGFAVAFSGGGDSTALLHAAASGGLAPRAVHVHHALHPDADDWSRHCRSVCDSLGVALSVLRVSVDRESGRGLEGAARAARYEALRRELRPGECLLTAHSLDDQAETLLLQLVRGAGLSGLSGMAVCQAFGPGRLVRPLLAFPRAELREYLAAAGVSWLEDPDNANTERSRVFLRREVIPLLERRWPAASRLMARAARNLQESRGALEALTSRDLAECRAPVGGGLRVSPLGALGTGRRRALLRHWLASVGLPEPSRDHLLELERQALDARADAVVRVTWPGADVSRYRGVLHARRPVRPLPDLDAAWETGVPLDLPHGLGRLSLEARDGAPPAWSFRVRLRRGGERILLPGREHHTELKQLFQEWGVPPWERERIPLLYEDGALVAVGDLQPSRDLQRRLAARRLRLRWTKA